jgi:hypothetical protein
MVAPNAKNNANSLIIDVKTVTVQSLRPSSKHDPTRLFPIAKLDALIFCLHLLNAVTALYEGI